GAVALSPFIRPGTVSQVPYNHYSLLRSVSAMFGVPPVGFAAAAGLAVLGDDVFTQPGGAPPGAAPLLQAATPLTGGGGRPNSGRAGGAVAGCRSASLPKARRGRFRRGSLLAAVSVRRNKRQATVTLRLNHQEVLLHRLGQLVALLDPLESRHQQNREGQVRVAGRVRAAQLHARGLLLAGVVERHPHER